jgi:hypothetical protein
VGTEGHQHVSHERVRIERPRPKGSTLINKPALFVEQDTPLGTSNWAARRNGHVDVLGIDVTNEVVAHDVGSSARCRRGDDSVCRRRIVDGNDLLLHLSRSGQYALSFRDQLTLLLGWCKLSEVIGPFRTGLHDGLRDLTKSDGFLKP